MSKCQAVTIFSTNFFSWFIFSQFKLGDHWLIGTMRQLKHHEKKLLKKVDFLQWKKDDDVREIKIIRRYHIQKREDYHKYVPLRFFSIKLNHTVIHIVCQTPCWSGHVEITNANLTNLPHHYFTVPVDTTNWQETLSSLPIGYRC